MTSSEAAQNGCLSARSGRALFLTACALSLPGYMVLLSLMMGYLRDAVFGHYPPAAVIAFSKVFSWTGVMALLGILTHPTALLVMSFASFFRFDRRTKLRSWVVVLGGIIACLIVVSQIRWR